MEEQGIFDNKERLFCRAIRTLKKELSYPKVFLVALAATFVFGICAHGFAFFNLNVSHDALYEFFNEISARQKFGIGRFIEPILRFLTGEAFVLPWLAGVIGLTFLACGTYLICKIFALRSVWQVVLLAGVFSVNVTVTALIAAFIHDFSGDALAFFLAVWVVYVWTEQERTKKKTAPLFIGLGAFVVLGIYQGYLGITVTLLLLYAALAFLRGEPCKALFKRLGVAVLALLAACVAYLTAALVIEKCFGQALSDYNSVNGALVNPLEYLLRMAKAYGRTFCILFVPDCGKMSTAYSTWSVKGFCIGNWLICLLNAAVLVYTVACCAAGLRRQKIAKGNFAWFLLCILLLPLTMNFAVVLSGVCHDVMKMGAWLFYLIALLLLRWYGEGKTPAESPEGADTGADERKKTEEKKTRGYRMKHAFALFPAVLVIVFSGMGVSNTSYVKKELDAQATLSSVTRLISEIEGQSGYVYGETEVAILGNFDEVHNDLPLFELDGEELFVAGVDYNSCVSYLATWKAYFDTVMRYTIRLSGYEKVDELKRTETVKNMPIYPREGSIRTVDGVIVVKLSYDKN